MVNNTARPTNLQLHNKNRRRGLKGLNKGSETLIKAILIHKYAKAINENMVHKRRTSRGISNMVFITWTRLHLLDSWNGFTRASGPIVGGNPRGNSSTESTPFGNRNSSVLAMVYVFVDALRNLKSSPRKPWPPNKF